jgi:pimeloyl-ACP methyl ester carboxylesterase
MAADWRRGLGARCGRIRIAAARTSGSVGSTNSTNSTLCLISHVRPVPLRVERVLLGWRQLCQRQAQALTATDTITSITIKVSRPWSDLRLTTRGVLFGLHDDPFIPVSHAVEASRRIPNSRLEIFERSSHSPQVEEPQRFVRVLTDFIMTTAPAPDFAKPDRATFEGCGGGGNEAHAAGIGQSTRQVHRTNS